MDSSSTSTSTCTGTPKVYRKLVDYSTHRATAFPQNCRLDLSLLESSQHSCRSSLKKPQHDPATCTAHASCKGRAKFLKENSKRNVTDSSATFGTGARRRSSNDKSLRANCNSLSQHFALYTKQSLLSDAEETSLTSSLSMTEASQNSDAALLLQDSLDSLDCSAVDTSTVVSREQQIKHRRSKMNWLANNSSKRDLMETPDHPPKTVKVINTDEEAPVTTTRSRSQSITSTRSESVRPSLAHAPSLRHLATGSKQLKSAPMSRRSSTSFVAGSRIRYY